ncbi:copper amine oxidase N-terminal domain-containing protein [Paenibacillus donghaensis]|uniref:Copper amine oxidase-like N-terminal domain-containing protein n=1 Tax=Paenibacillus donghaensis TaxID=414771 RepID=A0A2Z2KBN0_9BACL|nr:copper amine oxidase N-terminal domain-containing protein [Paenibacillus donghaensis]ASA21085.1 hypothetical protein B9T62_09980 [Paenibacillus donghaensis]
MSKMKARTRWLLPVIALLLVLAGCQPVGGMDVGKALEGNLDVKSSESSMSFSVKAVPAAGISAEDQAMVDLVNSFTLQVFNAKVQDNGNVSAAGSIGFKQMDIPFSLFMNTDAVVFNVEGAKQPFYIPLTDDEMTLALQGLDTAKAQELTKLLTKFIVRNLPNPEVINITPVTEAVYGEQLNLTKIHAEISGDQLPALLKEFLKSISKDTEGFTQVISGLYDYLYPMIKAEAMDNGNTLDLGFAEIPLDDKEAVVTVVHDAAKLGVDALLLVYDQQLARMYESTPELKTVLGKGTSLKTDIFMDSSLHIRKQTMDLNVALPPSDELPLESISFKAETQNWNIGGAVKADVISAEGALDVSTGSLTPGETLRNFETNSDVYRILKEDMGITKKEISIGPDDDYYYPIVDGNTTYVPLRYFAEDLGADVEWDTVNRAIVVTDDVYGDTLIFKIGSADVMVNGTKVKLEKPVFVDEYGDAYVPLRMLAEALHAKVEKAPDGWIDIVRE